MSSSLFAVLEELRQKLKRLLGTESEYADRQFTAGEAIHRVYRTHAAASRASAGRYTAMDADGAGLIGDFDVSPASRGVSETEWSRSPVVVPLAEIRPAGVSQLIRNVHEPTQTQANAMRQAYESQTRILSRLGDRPPTLSEVRELLQLVNPTKSRTAGNCMECSWAVRDILAGRPAVAGPSGAQKFIEPSTERFHADSHNEIHEAISAKLHQPGWNAIVSGNRYSDAFGHHYNVVNIDNQIYYVDGQIGTVSEHNIVPDGDYYLVFPTHNTGV
ncbi:toxin glutamine deamidase domain-containing protein [Nocardia brasiliensis]|uniref:toxin glutamine deamidase domain-containing protein n=1 Tax=Nocardia brasiliensis TaxID=37326 RepID=UPI002456A833|nr:toxin glutamine deamidase domain-containing protein [Nocardia brasiliensis]